MAKYYKTNCKPITVVTTMTDQELEIRKEQELALEILEGND